MAKKKDYYELLNVDRNAGEADLKKAFRRQAQKYHPDRNPDDKNATEKFQAINEAYEILKDKQKRQIYDQFGHEGLESGVGTHTHYHTTDDLGGVFNDLFENIFGGGGRRDTRRRQPQRGQDRLHRMEVSLEQAVFGDQIKINVPVSASCQTCDGSGATPGAEPERCKQCNGGGYVYSSRGGLVGSFRVQQTCPVCYGTGMVITSPCRKCNGQGKTEQHERLTVDIAKGTQDGTTLRYQGKGDAGANAKAPRGDLLVEIRVREHEVFTRRGGHLLCSIPVSFVDAVLGVDIEIPTETGRVKFAVPAGTKHGSLFRLKNRGGSGDLICEIKVDIPTRLSKHQRRLLEEWRLDAYGAGGKPTPQSRWFKGAKKFFSKVSLKKAK